MLKFQFILIHMFFLIHIFRCGRSAPSPNQVFIPSLQPRQMVIMQGRSKSGQLLTICFSGGFLSITASPYNMDNMFSAQGPKYGEIMIRNTRAKQTVIVNDMNCCKTYQPSNQVCN